MQYVRNKKNWKLTQKKVKLTPADNDSWQRGSVLFLIATGGCQFANSYSESRNFGHREDMIQLSMCEHGSAVSFILKCCNLASTYKTVI